MTPCSHVPLFDGSQGLWCCSSLLLCLCVSLLTLTLWSEPLNERKVSKQKKRVLAEIKLGRLDLHQVNPSDQRKLKQNWCKKTATKTTGPWPRATSTSSNIFDMLDVTDQLKTSTVDLLKTGMVPKSCQESLNFGCDQQFGWKVWIWDGIYDLAGKFEFWLESLNLGRDQKFGWKVWILDGIYDLAGKFEIFACVF